MQLKLLHRVFCCLYIYKFSHVMNYDSLLYYLHFGIAALMCAELSNLWTLALLNFFFHPSLGSFYFHHTPERVHFHVRFPRSQESQSWSHGNRTAKFLLLFLSPLGYLLLLPSVFLGPDLALSHHISLVYFDSRASDLWALDF